MQIQRFMNIAKKMVQDRKYRNHIIRRLTQEAQRVTKPPTETKLTQEEITFLATQKIGFVGGCELSFIKEFLETNGAQCYHTFDHNEPSNPFLAFNDEKLGLYSFKPNVVVVSDIQDIRNYISDIQNGATDFTKQETQLKEAHD